MGAKENGKKQPKSLTSIISNPSGNRCIRADNIAVTVYDTPVFVDCGSNLEEIVCPACGKDLSFDWWGAAMDKAHATDFSDLTVELPCCGNLGSLNTLRYNFPCGFARWVLEISDSADKIPKAVLSQIEAIAGEKLRVIEAHY